VTAALSALRAEGLKASGIACDVGDAASVAALADHAEADFGPIDIWVNNAGLSAPYGPTAHLPLAALRALVDTNIVGTMNGSVEALRRFLPRGRGKLVNLLGRGDTGSVPLQNAYSSSKVWVRNFTRALAKEYQDSGVGVLAFNPGLVRTQLLTEVDALRGWETKLRPLEVVTAIWGNEAEVPAARLLDLVSPKTDGRTGLVVKVLSRGFMMGRLFAALGRLVSGRGLGAKKLDVTVVEAPPGLD
jgi:glucose 1-dehydrogenase